jgi:prophage tail gpP-like protein
MQPVSKLVKNLCSPFGIEVAINPLVVADANKIVETFKADEGQSVYDIIAALLRDSTLLPLTEGDGALTITRASLAELSWDTISDSNTSGIMLDYNDYDRYSSYIVKGQGIGSDNKTTKDYIEPSATIADSGIARYRPSVIFAETATDNGKCKQRAIFEAHNRAGHSRRARLDVIGWQQFDGSLWAINSTVVVDLSLAGINKTMLIEEIEFIQDSENGEIARVSVVDIDTYGTSPALDITTELDR